MTGVDASAIREAALGGWLSAIAGAGWRRASVEDAAAAAGLTTGQVLAAVGDRYGAVACLQDWLADAVADGAATGADVRERLFDGLMQGFDLLQEHRAAVLAIRNSRDPAVAALVMGRVPWHVRRIAVAAGMRVGGLRGRARLLALGALCLRAFSAWRTDGSADMSATMAALDRLLDKAERAEREGLSPDLVGLPGLTALVGRLRP